MKAILILPLFLLACGASRSDDQTGREQLLASVPSVSQAMEMGAAPETTASGKIWSYKIIASYDHGEDLFTQGLFIADGELYESTGKVGHSRLLRHALMSDAPAREQNLPETVFGEGATAFGDQIISLTWRAQQGYVHRLSDLSPMATFPIRGEGWGLTSDGEKLIMSDGSNRLRFLDPKTFQEIGWLKVTAEGQPVTYLNELEWVEGEIWANVWKQDVIVRIDPKSGQVTGIIDMRGLHAERDDPDDVLNGIAYDPQSKRLFVTGKRWPKIYEIKLVEPSRN